MSNAKRLDIYYAFRRARFDGMPFAGACAFVAQRHGTSERAVRVTVIQHGQYVGG